MAEVKNKKKIFAKMMKRSEVTRAVAELLLIIVTGLATLPSNGSAWKGNAVVKFSVCTLFVSHNYRVVR